MNRILRLVAGCIFAATGASATAAPTLLYDVDFEAPTYTLGQPVVGQAGPIPRKTVSATRQASIAADPQGGQLLALAQGEVSLVVDDLPSASLYCLDAKTAVTKSHYGQIFQNKFVLRLVSDQQSQSVLVDGAFQHYTYALRAEINATTKRYRIWQDGVLFSTGDITIGSIQSVGFASGGFNPGEDANVDSLRLYSGGCVGNPPSQPRQALSMAPEKDYNVSLSQGYSQALEFRALDQFGKPLHVNAQWRVDSGPGVVDEAGLFTATAPNATTTVIGSFGLLEARITVSTDGHSPGEREFFSHVQASSPLAGAYDAYKANDGDLTTWWASVGGNPQWIMMGGGYYSGAQRAYDRVVLNWAPGAFSTDYRLEAIDENGNPHTVYEQHDGRGGIEAIYLTPTIATGFRLYSNKSNSNAGISLKEFEVYSTLNPEKPKLAKLSVANISTYGLSVLPVELAKGGNPPGTDSSYSFLVSGSDQYRRSFPVERDAPLLWTNSGVGEVNSIGNFFATSAGNAIVTARSGDVVVKLPVIVTNGTTPVNVALGKPATALSTEASAYAARNVNDGDTRTRWSSEFYDPNGIEIYLNGNFVISRVRLKWDLAYSREYKIEVSEDGQNYQVVYQTLTGGGGAEEINFAPTIGRYVRLYSSKAATSYGVSLKEFEVYGYPTTSEPTTPYLKDVKVTPAQTTLQVGQTATFFAKGYDQFGNEMPISASWSAEEYLTSGGAVVISSDGRDSINNRAFVVATRPGQLSIRARVGYADVWRSVTVVGSAVDLARNKFAWASSVESQTYAAKYAVDGNSKTRWSSKFSDPQWLAVDLGDAHIVESLGLTWETAYSSAFCVETSFDRKTWLHNVCVSNQQAGQQVVSLVPTTARYVRLNSSARGTPYGISLWDFAVYGVRSAQFMPVRIDAGSLPVRDNGVLQWGWRADTGFNTGNTTRINHTLNTFYSGEDDALYVLGSERWDPAPKPELGYEISVPNGRYLVKLHFAETWPGAFAVGKRVFDVAAQGAVVINDLDVYARVGAYTPLVEEVPVTVTNGKINITLIHGKDNPHIYGLEILPQ